MRFSRVSLKRVCCFMAAQSSDVGEKEVFEVNTGWLQEGYSDVNVLVLLNAFGGGALPGWVVTLWGVCGVHVVADGAANSLVDGECSTVSHHYPCASLLSLCRRGVDVPISPGCTCWRF